MPRVLVLIWLTAIVSAVPARPADKPVTPIPRAHAHNDYEHPRPLFDALDQGFCSVEADIFLTKDGLLVGHTPFTLKADRTLQKLYLDPLRARVKANGGKVYPDGLAFYLLIDVKTAAKPTCAELLKVLEEYRDILSTTRDGKHERKAVTVVVSGNADRETIAKPAVRYAAIDGRPVDLNSDAPADLIPWVSADWGSQFKWDGTGPMPAAEQTKLTEYVAKAHKKGRMVRFWGTPDRPEVWKAQRAADVDLINTDKLKELRAFLLADETERKKP